MFFFSFFPLYFKANHSSWEYDEYTGEWEGGDTRQETCDLEVSMLKTGPMARVIGWRDV